MGIEKLEKGSWVDAPAYEKNRELTFKDSERTGGMELPMSAKNEFGEKFFDDSERENSDRPQWDENAFNDDRVELQLENKKDYHDDNGNLYRIDNELSPNNEYEINGYKYKTDDEGRIVSAEGKLHIKDREGRLVIRDSIEDIGKGDQKEGDDRGHLIGDQFDGSNGLENMIPQDANINRNDFKNFENVLAKEVKEGKEVNVKIEPLYEGTIRRPSDIVVTYTVNGDVGMVIFPNNKE